MAHILIINADYYSDISSELLAGAKAKLEAGDHTSDVVTVPGAFEIPGAISMAIHGSQAGIVYDGYIALGCVVRGETTHYDYVCGECARGLQELAIHLRAAIGFGVLTVENISQAKERASRSGHDKGGEAAAACLRMIALKKQFGSKG
jgi:6,7-dimethyl-8-ribityllumazine synthase